MPLLNPGDAFPPLTIDVAGDGELSLPEGFAGRFAVVLLYRGSWCPFCNAQLRSFERARQALDTVGAGIVALSVDDEPTTKALIDKHHLTFPVGYGANAHQVAALTGAFVDPNRQFLQSTGFVLSPEGRVLVSVYSSGAIGRLVPDDVVGLIRYVRDHK